MIEFDIPANLDGAILIEELNAAGVSVAVNPVYERPVPTIREVKLLLDIAPYDKDKAQLVVQSHLGKN